MRRLVQTIIVGLSVGAMHTAALAQPAALSPEQIAQIFCIASVGNDMAPVEGLLTPDLTAAIATAETENDRRAAAQPDEKPPLGDGIPWQSFPDYADQCTPGSTGFMMDEAEVKLVYAFTGYPDATITDTLKLRLVDDARTGARVWRIDNIAYATDGNLRTTLLSAFMD